MDRLYPARKTSGLKDRLVSPMRELERESHPDTPPCTRLTIVGAGRVGKSLAAAARTAGIEVELAGRDEHAAVAAGAECVLLCVPDDAISAAAEVCAAADPPPRRVGHVSGASGLDALAAAARTGSDVFSLHPLQTIPDGDTDLHGTPCAIAAPSEEGIAFAEDLAGSLGMEPFELDEASRAAYHAAASISSNFLITLEESAARLLERAGVEDARRLLTPLVLRTAENWSERGGAALTGPIARGDEATVTRHMDALARIDADLLETYRVLARRTRDLAAEREMVEEPVS